LGLVCRALLIQRAVAVDPQQKINNLGRFNGEIYNYQAKPRIFEIERAPFLTQSDTVIVHLMRKRTKVL
jgi:asparagine synthetase B (glutamine-hydrolysing)